MELTDSPVKDFPLMWKVYDHIIAHPEEWSQDLYISHCGTKLCFAGHSVQMGRTDLHSKKATDGAYYGFYNENDEWVSAYEAGMQVLGLTSEEADELFYCITDDPGQIRDMIAGWEVQELSR